MEIQAHLATLPRPEALTDVALNRTLWELIRWLAAQRVYLMRTDHLSDRRLYAYLLDEGLEEAFVDASSLLPPGRWERSFHLLDMVCAGRHGDLGAYLRYYASERERRWWASQEPTLHIPPRERPPRRRDHRLPTFVEAAVVAVGR